MDAVPDIVDAVLWLLAALSVLTWAIMFFKAYAFWADRRGNGRLLEGFGRAGQVRDVRPVVAHASCTLANVGRAGLAELQALPHDASTLDIKDRREMLHHALRQQIHLEQSRLENGLAVLASVGSTSPFIGLFGTVWGIMHALKAISASGSAGLDVVAGPIGEALIATAMGIAAAIPAVLAYNYFLRKVRLSVAAMEHFADRFLHLAIKSGMKED
ncbi:MAG TPA: MotA/TolQ/ExbB proton channel family protein [Methylophilaceae bacterium]|nr:MotA/TolQ/ExbB proton channel family protein [Methylophilaceae bacterium]HQR60630.1 MotA/TolQ/ExbB proton channel family protein [Methylophilaceae bacterium]